jgi:hypothetical protein
VRIVVFTVAVLFIAAMTVLTVLDFVHNGVTGLGVVGALVLVVIGVGVIGAILHPPRDK